MIKTKDFVNVNNLKFAAGVPDSLTKSMCFELKINLK